MGEWNNIKTNPPEDGQLIRLRAIVDRDVWYLPKLSFSSWIVRSKVSDEKPTPTEWKPIEGGISYYDYHKKG